MTLFVTLAITSNIAETGQRIQNILMQISLGKLSATRQIALVRGHVALIVLFTEKNLNISTYVQKIIEQINYIHLDEGYYPTMKILADGFLEIFSNSESYQLGQHLLLGLFQLLFCSYFLVLVFFFRFMAYKTFIS